MSAVELRRRIDRAIERGRGGVSFKDSDIDLWIESGAYKALSDYADRELCQKRKDRSRSTSAESINSIPDPIEQTLKSSGMTAQPDVSAEFQRVAAMLPKPSRRLTANTSPKKPAQRAADHTTEQAA